VEGSTSCKLRSFHFSIIVRAQPDPQPYERVLSTMGVDVKQFGTTTLSALQVSPLLFWHSYAIEVVGQRRYSLTDFRGYNHPDPPTLFRL
jgi:hypothetical protein